MSTLAAISQLITTAKQDGKTPREICLGWEEYGELLREALPLPDPDLKRVHTVYGLPVKLIGQRNACYLVLGER